MLHDTAIRRSLDEYIKNRIREIPSDMGQTFPRTAQIWRCENEVDFLYGYYVGKIEEGALHYLLKATRASLGGYADTFEIRGFIEEYRTELRNIIKQTLEAMR